MKVILHQFRERGTNAGETRPRAIESKQELFPAATASEDLRIAARRCRRLVLVGAYFTCGGFVALTAWVPTHWKPVFDLSAVSAESAQRA